MKREKTFDVHPATWVAKFILGRKKSALNQTAEACIERKEIEDTFDKITAAVPGFHLPSAVEGNNREEHAPERPKSERPPRRGAAKSHEISALNYCGVACKGGAPFSWEWCHG